MLEDKDLCKLIYYPDNNPLDRPNVNGLKNIIDKRLLLLQSKIPLVAEEGTYVLVRVPNYRSSKGGYYISSLLMFDVYCHTDVKTVYDSDGNRYDRAMLIIDKIESIMRELDIGIGEDSLNGGGEVANNSGTFSGHSVAYANVDFRK